MKIHDIDAVTNKAIVFGALAAFITGVYVAIVVGFGEAIGTSAKPNLGLSILATALVALAYRPARARIQRLANRIVYGPRATPYEVLARFSDRVAGTYASEDVLAGMARILAEGTGAGRASVWLRLGGDLRPAASWPAGDIAAPDSDRTVQVSHHGEVLGALSVGKPSGEAFTPTEDKLLEDLASQAGQVLRNVLLTEELRVRLDEISTKAAELRASRQRIVAAQDEERRRLERNVHDGAQQHLVALAVKLRLARNLVSKDAARSKVLLIELRAEAAEALETLRALARGIYPPLLAEGGLPAALTAQSRKVGVHTSIESDSVGRYPSEIEAAVYFCCLEALQNVAKHASALAAMVKLHESPGGLQFTVTDDGVGFDPEAVRPGVGLQNMRDRVEALGGRLEVTSVAGVGTSVSGWVPLAAAGSGMRDQAAVALDQASASRSGPNTDFGI
jgi:signal transduction histidine kinase